MQQQEKHYAALAPIMALAGVFAHPMASTLLPLGLFFFFNWKKMTFARLIALRAADLAFSMQLIIFLTSGLLMIYISYFSMSEQQVRGIYSTITLIVLLYMTISLLIGIVQAFRGKTFSYFLSFKIGERVFDAVGKKKSIS